MFAALDEPLRRVDTFILGELRRAFRFFPEQVQAAREVANTLVENTQYAEALRLLECLKGATVVANDGGRLDLSYNAPRELIEIIVTPFEDATGLPAQPWQTRTTYISEFASGHDDYPQPR